MNTIGLSIPDYLVIVLYFLVILGIGWYFSRSKKNAAEFLLGGRKMSVFPIAISMLMTVFSTYSLVMGPGEIYNHGMGWSVVSWFLPYFGIVSILIFTRFFFKINAFTPFEYLSYRYDSKVRLLAAACNCYSQILYAGMVLLTSSKIFEAAAGWPCWVTILLVGGISIIYTRAGGLRAVVWTDVTQFFVMLVGMLALVISLCRLNPGGASGAVSYAFSHGHGLNELTNPEYYTLWPYVRLTLWALLITQLWGALGTGTGQMTVQRLMATGSMKQAVKAQLFSAMLTTPTQILLSFIGLATYSYYSQFPDPQVTQGDLALFRFVATKLPPLMPGVFVAAALAAAMSTLSSIFNGDAAVWLREFYLPYRKKDATDKEQVLFSQFATLMIGVLSVTFALLQYISSIWLKQTMVEVSMIFGVFMISAGLDTYIFAIFSRKASNISFWSMLAFGYGFKVSMLLWYMLSKRGEVLFASTGSPGLAGPISIAMPLIPLAVFAVILLMSLFLKGGPVKLAFRIASLLPLSLACGWGVWYAFSHTGDPSTPKVLSFTWAGVPGIFVNILFMLGWHWLGPEVPRERYAGLIWGHINERNSNISQGEQTP